MTRKSKRVIPQLCTKCGSIVKRYRRPSDARTIQWGGSQYYTIRWCRTCQHVLRHGEWNFSDRS